MSVGGLGCFEVVGGLLGGCQFAWVFIGCEDVECGLLFLLPAGRTRGTAVAADAAGPHKIAGACHCRISSQPFFGRSHAPPQAENEALQELLMQLAADKAAAQKQLSDLQSTFVPSATGG